MRWAGHVAGMRKNRNIYVYRVEVKKPEERRKLQRPKRKEGNGSLGRPRRM
jgi:hypothetical protein